jgi:hypothetical protein
MTKNNIVSKVLGKLLLTRLLPLVEHNGLIPSHQFGFRQKHSTTEQTHRIIHKSMKPTNTKAYCYAALLDISQAFDKVWHIGLLYKLRQSLPINYFILLQSFLQNRHSSSDLGLLSIPNPCRCSTRQCSRAVPIAHIHRRLSNLPSNLCWLQSNLRNGQWPNHSFPETPDPPQRTPDLTPQMAHAGQRTQIGPRYVHNTYRNVPTCPHEQCATSQRGSCQIPRTHLAPPYLH